VGEKALPHQLLLNGEALDPAPPLTLLLHKPLGCVVTSPDDERVLDDTVYDLLPYRCVLGRQQHTHSLQAAAAVRCAVRHM
jgi:16S rRNA U516 pseudouridylate synthase RsuA-like enzyme